MSDMDTPKPQDTSQSPPPPTAASPQPVAYDQQGRPLYAQPPQVVHLVRPHEPQPQQISDKVRVKHEQSKRDYPELNLSEGEYVISAIVRHPIGLFGIWAVIGLIVALTLVGLPLYASNARVIEGMFGPGAVNGEAIGLLTVILLLLCVLFTLGGIIATIVYNSNKFFLTNESVTQFLRTSIFSKKEQTISLSNIEDASYNQHGMLQHLLNYGSLRLSTEGDETTYRFNFVLNPKVQVATLNNAVEAFKNGRPFEDD
jgi:uncharacterized membrane protein